MTDGVFGDRELWALYVEAVSVIVVLLLGGFCLTAVALYWLRRRSRWEYRMRRRSESLQRLIR